METRSDVAASVSNKGNRISVVSLKHVTLASNWAGYPGGNELAGQQKSANSRSFGLWTDRLRAKYSVPLVRQLTVVVCYPLQDASRNLQLQYSGIASFRAGAMLTD